MLDDLLARDEIATIELAQTTFSHLRMGGELFKLTYRYKAEAYMKPGEQGLPALHWHHPMLLHYNVPKATIYVASKAGEPAMVSQEIEEAVGTVLHGWRDWRTDLFGSNKAAAAHLFQENLSDGYGILMGGAPLPVARAVLAVCDKHGIKTTIFGNLNELPKTPPKYCLLTIGSCYVIAEGLACVRL